MISTDELRGIIAAKGLSQRRVAKMLGISEKTFYTKMARGVFLSTEMQMLVDCLEIKDPERIFFAPTVTQRVTS
jgi:predicted transcriptional regulator